MNKIEKQRIQSSIPHPYRKWWSHNGYKILRVIFFYIYIPQVLHEKWNNYRVQKLKWDTKIADRILQDTLPYLLDYEEDKAYFEQDWRVRFYDCKGIKRRDKFFARNFMYEIKDYLFSEDFQIEGYTKKVVRDYYETVLILEKENH